MKDNIKKNWVVERFHSKTLIPWEVLSTAMARGEDLSNLYMCDTVMDWMEGVGPTFRFDVGDEVAHKENIGLKMEVVDISKSTFKRKNKDGSVTEMMRMNGIDCGWWL